MGKIFNIKVWLEDREINVLKKYNFKEEVFLNKIDEHDKLDLERKGFLVSYKFNNETYYQGYGGYIYKN